MLALLDGCLLGDLDCICVGKSLGCVLGVRDRICVGASLDCMLGVCDCIRVGALLGCMLGVGVERRDGPPARRVRIDFFTGDLLVSEEGKGRGARPRFSRTESPSPPFL